MTSVPAKPPKLLPPHYLVLTVLGSAALVYGLPDGVRGAPLLGSPWPWLGALPMVAGVVVAFIGSRQFAAAETNIIPFTPSSSLVQDGVFAHSRNPMYLGMMLFTSGWAIVLNHAWPWLLVIAFFCVIRFAFIAREEVLMHQTFGADYAAYQQAVRRWL